MFSALKKLAKGGDERCPAPVPMSSSLQKKFSKGVHYNMKILIKGDRNVGKSCLLQRLQGGPFIEQYAPTDQIQVAPIHWAYKNTDYIVKVEVWEVVDKGRTRKKPPLGLKLENQSSPAEDEGLEAPILDASFMDVHKNAHGVILMMDITKPWTFDYVVKELARVPSDLPVVVLGNHCDMMHHRQVHLHHIDTALQQARDTRSAPIRYAESSMRNGFGLRFLHKFLSIPFLRLQRESLLLQLQRNESDAQDAEGELDEYQDSAESDYTSFTERLASKRRESGPGNDSPAVGKSIVLGGGKPIVPPNVNPLLAQSLSPKPQSYTPERDRTNHQPSDKEKQSSYVSPELLKTKPVVSMDVTPTKSGVESTPTSPNPGGALDEFYAGTLDSSFLDDLTPISGNHDDHSDSDDGNVKNPMVTLDEDDLDIEYFENTTRNRYNPINTSETPNLAKTADKSRYSMIDYSNLTSDLNKSKSEYKKPTSDFKKSSSEYKKPTSDLKKPSSEYNNPTSDFKNSISDYDDPASDLKNRTNLSKSTETQNVLVDRLMKTSMDSENMEFLSKDLDLDADYMWTADCSARRSPEGGEDPDLLPKESEKSEKKHKKKKSKEKEDRYKEKGDGDTKKEKKHKQRRAKDKDKKSPQQDLLSPGITAIDFNEYDSI